jgi:diguanylate cyclase (GGDEF)-like protein
LLSLVAERLKQILRKGDAVGRLGGDEFLVLFGDVLSSADAQRIGDRVADLLDGVFALAVGPVQVSASVGVSWICRESATADELVAWADAAMYAAKRAGRRRAVLHGNTAPPTGVM